MRSALDNVRVCDFTNRWAGPWCATQLADLGAEVIKVESREWIDAHRNSPPFADGQFGWNRAGVFNSHNRNKKSCTLNLTKPAARELAKELIKLTDVVVENMRPGTMERLGLGYEHLQRLRPDVIMVSLSGFGATGLAASFGGQGDIAQGFAGLSLITGYDDGFPQWIGLPWPDPLLGMIGAYAVLAALSYRARTGRGQHIDCSMVEAVATLLPEGIMECSLNSRQYPCLANRDQAAAPHGCYPCRGDDQWVTIAVFTDHEWEGFCQALGVPEWAKDERFSDALSRWRNQAELDQRVAEWTKQHTPYEVMRLLQGVGVAAGPTLSSQELLEDQHLRERGFFVELNHPEAGKRTEPGLHWKMSRTPGEIRRAPLLGEHNDYVFGELLGLSSDRMAQLTEQKVIY